MEIQFSEYSQRHFSQIALSEIESNGDLVLLG